jgi:hypothetical protein
VNSWPLRLALVAAGALACSCDSSADHATQQAKPRPITVTSTLHGRANLPPRIRWTVTTSLPTTEVREVQFLIGNKLRWVDRQAPYSFAGDGGYLITTLAIGVLPSVTFISRVVSNDGRTASEVVQANVPPPPQQTLSPLILGRRVTAADLKKSGAEPPPPAGRWQLYLDPGGGLFESPHFGASARAYQYLSTPRTLRIYAPIRLGPEGIGGTYLGYHVDAEDCGPTPPFAIYRWSTGHGFNLTAIRDPCGARRAILEGTWRSLD